MSTILADADASVRSNVIHKVGETSDAVKAKRDPIWAILVLTLGLLSSLAWSGFLAWVVGRTIGVW
jgi:hypothetical protein